jgi:hypothetical protein
MISVRIPQVKSQTEPTGWRDEARLSSFSNRHHILIVVLGSQYALAA